MKNLKFFRYLFSQEEIKVIFAHEDRRHNFKDIKT